MTTEQIEFNKVRFIEVLASTGRDGVQDVLKGLDANGFFIAPASSKHHLAEEGGLAAHSLNVYDTMMKITTSLRTISTEVDENVTNESIAIVALLHDVCKSDVYKPCMRNRKNANGHWEQYQSWEVDYKKMPFGHGEKSLIMLLNMGLKMSVEEMLAIRWHMGKWDLSDSYESLGNMNAAMDEHPLITLLMAADMLASRIIEKN